MSRLLDFNRLTGGVTEWAVAYAVCYVWNETPQKNLILKVGSDDQSKVYLNGKLVHQIASQRSYIANQDSVPEVELKGGINTLVFKVANEQADWKGSIRFTDSTGHSAHGLRFMLDPNGH